MGREELDRSRRVLKDHKVGSARKETASRLHFVCIVAAETACVVMTWTHHPSRHASPVTRLSDETAPSLPGKPPVRTGEHAKLVFAIARSPALDLKGRHWSRIARKEEFFSPHSYVAFLFMSSGLGQRSLGGRSSLCLDPNRRRSGRTPYPLPKECECHEHCQR